MCVRSLLFDPPRSEARGFARGAHGSTHGVRQTCRRLAKASHGLRSTSGASSRGEDNVRPDVAMTEFPCRRLVAEQASAQAVVFVDPSPTPRGGSPRAPSRTLIVEARCSPRRCAPNVLATPPLPPCPGMAGIGVREECRGIREPHWAARSRCRRAASGRCGGRYRGSFAR